MKNGHINIDEIDSWSYIKNVTKFLTSKPTNLEQLVQITVTQSSKTRAISFFFWQRFLCNLQFFAVKQSMDTPNQVSQKWKLF